MTEKADEDTSSTFPVLILSPFLGWQDIWGEIEEWSWEYKDMNTRQPGVSRTFSVCKTLPLASVTLVWRITEFLESFYSQEWPEYLSSLF